MLAKDITPEILVAYADGELSKEETSEVKAILENNKLLKEEAEEFLESGRLLKNYYKEISQETPEYLRAQIDRMFDEKIDKEVLEEGSSSNIIVTFLRRFLSPQSLAQMTAAFFIGISVAPILFTTNQITLRGTDTQTSDTIEFYIIQKGIEIKADDYIELDVSSTLRLRSAYNGQIDIFAVIDGVDTEILSDIDISANKYIDMPSFVLTDEESFDIRIELQNEAEGIQIIKKASFPISK